MTDTPEKPKPAPAGLSRIVRLLAAKGERENASLLDGGTLITSDEEALFALRAWGQENARHARDKLTAELRRQLAIHLKRNAGKLGEKLTAELRSWAAQEAAPENLSEWLERHKGWDAVDGDAVEARLVVAARAAGLQGVTAFVWPSPDKPLLLLYDLPRAAGPWIESDGADKGRMHAPQWDTSEARQTWVSRVGVDAAKRIMAGMALLDPTADLEAADKAGVLDALTEADLLNLLTPEWTGTPRETKIVLGLDALRAGLAAHDWPTLALCLTDVTGGNWLGLLAGTWLIARADRAQTRAKALPMGLQPRNVITARATGAAFLRFPTVLKDAGAWCGSLVAVDGDTIFAEEPDLAAAPVRVLKDPTGADVQLYKPRAWTVAAEHRLAGPRQLVLPGVTLDAKGNPDVGTDLGAYLAVTATGAAVLDRLPGLCAKLLPLLFALCPLDGTPVKGPIADLVKLLYPDWRNRRQMAMDVTRVGAALTALMGLRIVEALPTGGLRFYPVLHPEYFDAPTGPDQSPEACLRLNSALADLATPTRGKGDFVLLNLSRLMDLDAKSPDRIAVALRLAAYWHLCRQRTADGRRVFLPDRVGLLPVDDLLVTINAPGRAANVIAGEDVSPMGRRKLSEARARLVDETLPALVDAGLVGKIEAPAPGDRRGAWLVKALPPADYLEACNQTGRTRRTLTPKRRRKKAGKRRGSRK